MDEKDRQFIEALFSKQGEQFQQQLGATTAEFKQHVSAVIENFDHKIGLLANVTDEVAAHRADTEAHHGVYRVKES